MKKRIFTLVLVCLFFSFCATSSQISNGKPYWELRVYENVTVDQLLKSCRLALEEYGYRIRATDNIEGLRLIKADWKGPEQEDKSYLEPERVSSPKRLFPARSAYLSISISEKSGKVSLLCEAKTGGGPHTANRHAMNKEEAKSFFEKLDKFLIKKKQS